MSSTQVTVVYGESKLQKTISVPSSCTVAMVKRIGSDEISKHLGLQPSLPAISLDDDCIDFYPGVNQS
jgi:hypothetical protein